MSTRTCQREAHLSVLILSSVLVCLTQFFFISYAFQSLLPPPFSVDLRNFFRFGLISLSFRNLLVIILLLIFILSLFVLRFYSSFLSNSLLLFDPCSFQLYSF
jgi:hypothetical protein